MSAAVLAALLHDATCYQRHSPPPEGEGFAWCSFKTQPWPTQWHIDRRARSRRWAWLRRAEMLRAAFPSLDDDQLVRIATILAGRADT